MRLPPNSPQNINKKKMETSLIILILFVISALALIFSICVNVMQRNKMNKITTVFLPGELEE